MADPPCLCDIEGKDGRKEGRKGGGQVKKKKKRMGQV
jgi:hypothetical protein